MIPYGIDPSLHAAEPEPPRLDDGFSPPHHDEAGEGAGPQAPPDPEALGEKSSF